MCVCVCCLDELARLCGPIWRQMMSVVGGHNKCKWWSLLASVVASVVASSLASNGHWRPALNARQIQANCINIINVHLFCCSSLRRPLFSSCRRHCHCHCLFAISISWPTTTTTSNHWPRWAWHIDFHYYSFGSRQLSLLLLLF